MPSGEPWPRVSIVTPSYNQGQFIEETIRSVLLQEYPNLEYIIIDGGSTDGSVDIIRKYEKWLAYWVSEPDQGQSHAINKGWEQSSGKIVAWLNSDDVYAPGAIAQAAAYLSAHPQVAIVYGQTEVIDETERYRHRDNRCEPFDLQKCLSTAGNPIPQASAFICRFALDKVGMLDPELHLALDWDLWIRVGLYFEIAHAPEIWSFTRFHPSAKTWSQVQGFGLDKVHTLDRVYEMQDLPLDIRMLQPTAYAAAHLLAANGFYLVNQFSVARSHWWKSVCSNPWLVARRGKGLALRLLLNPSTVQLLRRAKKSLSGLAH